MSEDPPEDIAQHAQYRAQAEAASGWNGSLSVFVPEKRSADPCRPELRERLKKLRDAAAARAAMEAARREQARPWVVTWIAADGVEFEREVHSRARADGLVFSLMSRGFRGVRLDGAAC